MRELSAEQAARRLLWARLPVVQAASPLGPDLPDGVQEQEYALLAGADADLAAALADLPPLPDDEDEQVRSRHAGAPVNRCTRTRRRDAA